VIATRSTPRPPRVTLDELAQPCARCTHQGAVHTGGASRSGWAVFDPVWAAATGWCSTPDCTCPARTSDPSTSMETGTGADEPPAVVAPPPPRMTPLDGPCVHGPGPCGNPDTTPYADGPKCRDHPTLGADWLKPRPKAVTS
jgi:hypothetical protein